MSDESNTSQAPYVLRTDEGAIAVLTLNRPKAYNALSIAMMEALLLELEALDKDPTIAVVVLQGSGKGFCAGHDLKEIRANPEIEFRRKTFDTCSRMMLALTNLRQPVIARVHGIATAAGCQMVATCDLAISATTAQFGTPGVNIGLFCSTPMVALSRAVSRKHAMEMLLTGEMIDSQTAQSRGLINRNVPDADLDQETMVLARRIASKSHRVLKTGKEAFHRQIEMPLTEAYAYTSDIMTENLTYDDAEEGIAAFIEKRPPVWHHK